MKEAISEFVRGKYFKLVILIEAFAVIIAVFESGESVGVNSITRREYGKGSIREELLVSKDDDWEKVEVTVSEKELSDSLAKEYIEKAKEEARDSYLGDNTSSEAVWQDLKPAGEYAEGIVTAVWSFEPSEYIEAQGAIKRDIIDDPVDITGTCRLTAGKMTDSIEVRFRIYPPGADTTEGLSHIVDRQLKKADEAGGDEVILPKAAGGKQLSWKRQSEGHGSEIALFGLIAALAMVFGSREEKKRQEKLRQKELSIDYPDIISKLSLYLGAGFSVKKAFEQIANTYRRDLTEGRRRASPGYEGICELCRHIADGRSEMEAYRDFSNKMNHRDYRKLVMLLTQNLRKGNRDLLDQLESEEENAFEERKNRAKVAGEEASTKLLLPMMGLLMVVMLVLVVPAFMTMSI